MLLQILCFLWSDLIYGGETIGKEKGKKTEIPLLSATSVAGVCVSLE